MVDEVAGGRAGLGVLDAPRYGAYGAEQLDAIAARYGMAGDDVEVIRAVSAVFPFRVNASSIRCRSAGCSASACGKVRLG